MCELTIEKTSLFPHANPGVMDDDAMALLRPTNPSMGLMLENISPRLMEPGMPHHDCPDKDPAVRVETIRAAGRAQVPFTTGILVGIGETPGEVIDSLFALRDLAEETGCVQEVIIQNFRAKADTPKRRDAEPTVQYFARVVAAARWILGPQVNLQVPPNLTERYEVYLDAPRRRDQRLGRGLAAHHRLRQPRGSVAAPRGASRPHRGRRVPADAAPAGVPGVHRRCMDRSRAPAGRSGRRRR